MPLVVDVPSVRGRELNVRVDQGPSEAALEVRLDCAVSGACVNSNQISEGADATVPSAAGNEASSSKWKADAMKAV